MSVHTKKKASVNLVNLFYCEITARRRLTASQKKTIAVSFGSLLSHVNFYVFHIVQL